MRRSLLPLALLACLALASCSKKLAEEAPAPEASSPAAGLVGQANAPGNFLAYEHEATVRVPAAGIAGRIGAVREACMSQAHGDCTVLGEKQSAGEWPGGRLVLRAEPKAIEPLVAMAAEGGELAQRSTRAEDLADAVKDNGLRRQRLRMQYERLQEFVARKDIQAADLIAVSGQMAQIEAELQAAEQEAAQQQRRIRTNLLTLEFQSERVTAESSELRMALRDALEVLDASVATLVTVVVAVFPFALFGVLIVWIVRVWRRRRRRRDAG